MKKIIKAGQRFSRRRYDSLDDARKELADEPYKLELIDLKGGAAPTTRRRQSRSTRSGELTIYDNVHAHTGEVVWSRPVPRPARADHQATSRRSSSCAPPRRTGGAARRTRSCSASTAPRGRRQEALDALPGADRRGRAARPPPPRRRAGPVLVPRRDRLRACAVFHPKGGVIRREMEDYTPAPPRGGGLRVRQHPAHHQGPAVRDLRPPRLVRRRHVPAHAARRGARTPTAQCASRGRTTTSSR